MPLPRPTPLACAIALAVGIAVVGVRRDPPPPGTQPDDRIEDRIVGTIGGPVVRTAHGVGAPLHAERTTIWMWTSEPVRPGQRVAVTGRLRTPRGMLGPGAPDQAMLVASRGAAWEMTAIRIEPLGESGDPIARVWRWATALQATWASRVPGDDPAAAALRGIVTGDRAGIPPSLDQRWRALGIYHVLSVSGLHLAVIAGLAFALLRRLIAASPWGSRIHPARWAAPVALVLAVTYTLATGGQLATLRALLVVTVALVAQMLDRPVRLIDAIGVAAIAILIWRPADLFDPSFQLSFTAALTLALRPRGERAATWRRRAFQWLVRGLATSAWVSLTTAPITAHHFQQVAIGGVVGNLLLTAAIELVALPLGLVGVLVPGLGEPLVALAVLLVGAVDAAAAGLARIVPIGTIAVASPLVMAVLVILSVALAGRSRRTRRDLLAWLVLCAVWATARTPPPLLALRVTFLDVGQGDAALVELPGGAVWLIDAGGLASARTLAGASAPGRAIERALAAYGHDRIDLAIISHPHPDHYLGLAALTVPIGELWDGGEPPGELIHASPIAAAASPAALPTYAALRARLAARGTRLVHPPLGTLVIASGVELSVWAPRHEPAAGAPVELAADPVRSLNDNSLVVTISYAGRTLLFTGDLEVEGEELIVAAGLPRIDVVKVAHHGSPTSSTARFVEATRPALAVISCGVANQFGFPAPAVVARWRDAGALVERTDRNGAITVTITHAGRISVDRFVP
jgi:competence protein ComEC